MFAHGKGILHYIFAGLLTMLVADKMRLSLSKTQIHQDNWVEAFLKHRLPNLTISHNVGKKLEKGLPHGNFRFLYDHKLPQSGIVWVIPCMKDNYDLID